MARKEPKTAEIVGNLDPTHWVQKSDPLVLMRSVPFSLGELKILDTYISRINANDPTRRTVIFTKEEYEELMGLSCVDYRTLKKHTGGMLGKVVTLEMPNKEYVQFVLFEQAQYHKDEYGKPIVEMTCTTLAQDLFFCINKYHYFKYALENVINLTRKASYLLYVYIRANRYRGKWEIDLNELRDSVLDCKGQESYLAFKEFKRAVLDPAVKEVNKKTDINFNYFPVKKGRKVASIKFEINTLNEQLSLLENNIDYDIEQKDDTISLLSSVTLDEFTENEYRALWSAVCKAVPNDEERFDFFISKWNRFSVYAERKKIKDRFNYFLAVLSTPDRKKWDSEEQASYDLDEFERSALTKTPKGVKNSD